MRIDFHTHTAASDGELTPGQLLARAVASNINLLAITDHDTVAGYRLAVGECFHHAAGLRLIPGVEFSCRWSATTVHILGLGMDCDHAAMSEALAVLDTARHARGKTIASKLEKLGFTGALDGAIAVAGDSQLGRPHFATWMVARGHVADHQEAFKKYLGQGKVGDVKAYWPELAAVVRWIVTAGGVAVIAHPLKYAFTRTKLRRLVVEFTAAGGSGIELISGHQNSDQTAQLRRLAVDFGLEVSAGSDFHRDGPYSPQLGVESSQLQGLRGVWERWSAPTADNTPAEAVNTPAEALDTPAKAQLTSIERKRE